MFVFSLLFLCSSFSVFATSPTEKGGIAPIVKIKSVENEISLRLYFANLLQQTTYLELVDKNGKSVYNETIADKASYAKKLDLSKISNGTYTVFVENDRIEVTQPILIAGSEITVLEEKRIEKVAPTMEYKDNAIFFQLAPSLRAKRVTVNILQGEEIVYESKEIMMSTMQKQYTLDNLYRGTYTFRVIVDGKAYYKKIAIQ